MSLYGALYSGVAGLAAQSNKIGIISDNIANVNTVGYKGTRGNFETLVTSSSSAGSAYSPGGVLGTNQQLVDKQGLLASTSSPTDIAISGDGFFVVNQKNDGSGQVSYTRAGSFTQDSTGNFRNAAGFFLQAWRLDPEGRLPGEPGNLNTVSSANLTSLTTVNVKNLTGVAAATSNVSIGANLNSAEGVYPGASGTLFPDTLHVENTGIKAKDVIVPGGVNNLTRGDRFTVATSSGLSYTYRYSGFTYGRDVNNTGAAALGDSGASVLSSPTALIASSAAITSIASPASTTLASKALTASGTLPAITSVSSSGVVANLLTITTSVPNTHLKTGDAVNISGVVGQAVAGFVDGVPIAEINGTHIVTVIDSTHYTIATTTATGGTSVTDSPVASTTEPLPFSTTASSTTVTVYSPAHGLVSNDYVDLSGNADIISGIPAANFNGSFKVTVVDSDHYTITVATPASATASGGGGTSNVSNAVAAVGHQAFTNIGNTLTVTTTAAHGLATGDSVTIAGIVGSGSPATVDGVPITEINGNHIVTVIDATHYTIATTAPTNGYGVTDSSGAPTDAANPFEATLGSANVVVRQVGHGLKDGQVVTLSGNTTAVGGISAGSLNGTFIVHVIDADHYRITTDTVATSTAAGGAGTVSATTRLSTSGNILDASNSTTPFLSTTGTSQFSAAALKFSITTGGITTTFSYTSASPNTSATSNQFNNLANLAEAINNVNGLSARVSGGRLYVGATDANAAVTFANGSDVGTAGTPVQWGLDWVKELGLTDIQTGTDRFSTLQGLSDLVNNSSGLTATISGALSAASLKINVDDPLGTITFSDRAAAVPVTLGTTPIATTTGSASVVVTVPSTTGYLVGDVIDMGTLAGGPYNGISAANLSGKFRITAVTSTSVTIVAKNSDVANASSATGPSGISFVPPTNYGSIVSEFGIGGVASLNNAAYTPQSTGTIGPVYDPTSATKSMASGNIVAQFSRPIRIYDSLGGGHDLTVSFIKSASNKWAVEVYASTASEVTSSKPNGLIATGNVFFNGDGSLQSVDNTLQSADVSWTNGAVSSTIAFNWGTAGSPFGTPNTNAIGKTDGLSQFNSAYRVNFANQNGAPVGDLTGVSITEEGFVVASYSNGQTQNLFKIPLASFANPDQLASSSGNVFTQSANSGEVNLRKAGDSGVGKIASSQLEQSNVELADQLTDMIVAQRAYQANTKVISTTDQLLSQLNDILR